MPEQKSKILVVDDDDFLRSIYVEDFTQAGFEVLEAKDGLEGLNLATASKPDAVFTGIIMPNMTGFELIQAIKKNVTTANIPFVVFSHLGREEDRQKAQELGAKAFFIKGQNSPKEIADFVKNILTQKEKIFKVAVDLNQLDAQNLLKQSGSKSGALTLELSPEPDGKTYKAKII